MAAIRTVVIAGGGGFLGGYLARHFGQAGWKVVGIGRRPREAEAPPGDFLELELPGAELPEILRRARPDVLINAAGTAQVAGSFERTADDFVQNVEVTGSLLEAVRRAAPACRFVQLSSAAVYGNPEKLPIAESARTTPISPYGYHKWQGELACQEYAKLHGLWVGIARIFSAYGKGLRRQVIWDFTRRLQQGGEVGFGGTGREERDFLHAADVAAAVALIAREASGEADPVNVASGQSRTIASVAQDIAGRLAGAAASYRFTGAARPGNPDIWRVDISRLASLGFRPSISWEKGLADTVAWIRGQAAEGTSDVA